jgi:pyruvate formate lyase activating enzyme
MDEDLKGLIFDIQRFSVHDGPGIRTTVFLKGCTLRCFWCQNPEGLRLRPEVMFYPERCIGCGNCLSCPREAHRFNGGRHIYLRERCIGCGECVENCYSGALKISGRWMSVEEVMKEIMRDRVFYEVSGGGVTLSGGDPLMQSDFSLALLRRCKEAGLHTAIETAANCRWEEMQRLLPFIDLVIMDIKHMDPEAHRRFTGVSNRLILSNARRLAETRKPMIIRVPVIPGVNDTAEQIRAIAEFVRPFKNLRLLELLPFHRLGEGKYRALGLDYPASGLRTPAKANMKELVEIAKESVPNTQAP